MLFAWQVGTVVDNAVVERISADVGLTLSLPIGDSTTSPVPAFAHISALSDTRIEKINKVRFALNTLHSRNPVCAQYLYPEAQPASVTQIQVSRPKTTGAFHEVLRI